jgi:hypothetical protein
MRKKAPNSAFPRLTLKMRAGGFAWLKTRLAAEVMLPITRIGQTLHFSTRRGVGAVAAMPRTVRRALAVKYPHVHDVSFAFYDLKVAPVTFDFVRFLAAARWFCRATTNGWHRCAGRNLGWTALQSRKIVRLEID